MRLICLTLCLSLALSSLAFAPAPLPQRERETAAREREREVADCSRRLKELGVDWRVGEHEGRLVVLYKVAHPSGNSAIGGAFWLTGGLARTLRRVVESVEAYVRGPR